MLHPQPHPLSHEIAVELDGVSAGYQGDAVIEDVTLRIKAGDFVGLLGPSGSGKSTLLKTILGAVDVYAGSVRIDGKPQKGQVRAGYVPQLETVDWNFPVTVEQVVMMGRAMESGPWPWSRPADRGLVREMFDRLGIAAVAKRHIRELSGGQQQRVFLARALVSSPRLLLLDEPTVGVDIKTRDEILHLLDELNHEGITIVMTTHELNAVAAHLPRVVCLNRRVIAEGQPSEVFTPAILKQTYNAEMEVIRYKGLTLVAETPHLIGRNGRGESELKLAAGAEESTVDV